MTRTVLVDCKESPKDFADCVCKNDPDGRCQQKSVSEYSPGPVKNEECLARFVFHPTHIQDNDLNETLFNDVFKYGASCNRKSYCDEGQIHARGNGLQNEHRTYRGYATLSVGFLRGIPSENGVRVYDTAWEDNQCHADIVAYPGMAKKERKSIRMALLRHALNNGGITPCCTG